MVTDSEIRHLGVPDQIFAYSDSYLRAATASCSELAQASRCSWADGAVVLMMAAHATELFLKGMLLKRAPAQKIWSRGHDIEGLTADYRAYFPGSEFNWDVPFRTEYPEGTTVEEIAAMAPFRDPAPSVLFRYPVNKTGEDWRGLYGFEPNSFLPVLRRLKDDFTRLRALAV